MKVLNFFKFGGELEIGGVYYLGRTKTAGGHIDNWRSERKRVPMWIDRSRGKTLCIGL